MDNLEEVKKFDEIGWNWKKHIFDEMDKQEQEQEQQEQEQEQQEKES